MEEEVPWIEDVDEVADNKHKDDDNDEDDDDENDVFGSQLFSIDQKVPQDEFQKTFVSDATTDRKMEITLTLTGVRARNPHLLQSTGLTLWKGSELLCQFLVDHPEMIQNRTVLELGSGLGLCGIMAHKVGAQYVLLTDGDTDTLANLRNNVAKNLCKTGDPKKDVIDCKQLLWGKNVDAFREKWAPNERHDGTLSASSSDSSKKGFDIVMGGDVAYAQESLEILFETALTLLSKQSGSIFLLSFVFRGGVTIESTLECAKRHELEWSSPPNGQKKGVYIFSRVQE